MFRGYFGHFLSFGGILVFFFCFRSILVIFRFRGYFGIFLGFGGYFGHFQWFLGILELGDL